MLRECFSLKINEAGCIYIHKKSTLVLLLLLYLKCVEMWTFQRLLKDFTVYRPLEDEYERYLMLQQSASGNELFSTSPGLRDHLILFGHLEFCTSEQRMSRTMTDHKQDHYSGRTVISPTYNFNPPKIALLVARALKGQFHAHWLLGKRC